MEKHTIDILKRLREGESISLTKSETDEVSELILKLKNLGILHQPKRFSYASDSIGRKNLAKLIELNSLVKFLEWLDEQNTTGQITNDFSGSTIGQVNQSDFLKVKQNEINLNSSPKKNLLLSKLIEYWWTFIIALIVGIILIMIEKGIINIGI